MLGVVADVMMCMVAIVAVRRSQNRHVVRFVQQIKVEGLRCGCGLLLFAILQTAVEVKRYLSGRGLTIIADDQIAEAIDESVLLVGDRLLVISNRVCNGCRGLSSRSCGRNIGV